MITESNLVFREWLFIASNVAVIIVGIQVSISVGRINQRVDTMWKWFESHIIIKQ